jgi:hypothetical protein
MVVRDDLAAAKTYFWVMQPEDLMEVEQAAS